ncbi:MAG: ABC transporter substrate-binding protein [Chloroflexi bacterium]|nr:ABC transporter substrate-binding protein [Chloroflexota bacterium]
MKRLRIRQTRMNDNRPLASLGAFAALVGLSLLLTACGGAAPAGPSGQGVGPQAPSEGLTGKPKQGGTLVIGVNIDVDSMDPNRTSGIVNQLMWFSIMDMLLYEDRDKKLTPGLAESWEISPDGREYTFKLRKGVKFQDGATFNAEAVKVMFDRIGKPDNVRALAYSYMNAADYAGTDVVDEYTARLRMKQPNNTLLTRLTRGYFSVPSPKAVREMGDQEFAKKPVGSGPFIFKEWVPGDRMVADRWGDYAWPSSIWQEKGPAYLERIVFKIVPENAARAAALETGEIQVAQNLTQQDVARFLTDKKYNVVQAVQQGMAGLLYVNTEKSPTNELVVRQAISHAVNREAIIRTQCSGIPKIARSVLSSSTYGFDESLPDKYPFDQAKARALLDEAGWKPGPDGIRTKGTQRLTLAVPTVAAATGCDTSPSNAVGELVQAQLREVGIEMKIEPLSGPAATEFEIQGKHNMTLGGFINEDPDVVRTQFHSSYIDKKSQPSRFRNPRFDEVLTKQYETPKGPERLKLLQEMQRLVQDNALVVPIYQPVASWTTRNNVGGIWIGSANYYPYFRYAYFFDN